MFEMLGNEKLSQVKARESALANLILNNACILNWKKCFANLECLILILKGSPANNK